jgi:transcriptional regulator with XRE-family HTH domain
MPHLLGTKLRYLRHQHDTTQVELARRLSLASYTHITKLEASQDAPSLGLVLRIAGVFGVTSDYLLRDTMPVEEIAASVSEPESDPASPAQLFGSKLHALRRQHNLTQVVLASQLGLASRAYISNLETGRKAPSLDLVVQIADLFGVTIDYLLRDAIPVGSGGATQEDGHST